MIHIGRDTKSTIIAKGISAGKSDSTYRGLVRISPTASDARNFTQCDSLLIGHECGAHFPYIESKNSSCVVRHGQAHRKLARPLFVCQQRGIDAEKAVSIIVNGFCKDVFEEPPMSSL